MEFQTYLTEEYLTRVHAVNNMPVLTPEDGTNMFQPLRPYTVEITYHRPKDTWVIFRVDIRAYRVRAADGRNSLQTRTVLYHGEAFTPTSFSSIPAWLKDWVLAQKP